MWPTDLYNITGAAGIDSGGLASITGAELEAVLETYRTLAPLERAGVQFAVTLVAAVVVLGLLQGYGPRTVAKARRSPVISICIGLPGLLVLGGLTSAGYLITGTSFGTFFGIPLVVLGGAALPIATLFGLVATGRTIASRLGDDRLPTGVLVAALVAGLAGLSLPITAAVAALAGALGIGAGVRVIMGAGGSTHPDERTVPPANKI